MPKNDECQAPLTVGAWREVLKDLPDDTPIFLKMGNDPPDNLVIEYEDLEFQEAIPRTDAHPFDQAAAVWLTLSVIDLEDEDDG